MCRKFLCLVNILCFIGILRETIATKYSEEDENYGKTWMYFADGNNMPQVANLTNPPPDGTNSRGRSQSVRDRTRFELYKNSNREPKVMQLRKRRSVDEFTGAFDPELNTFIICHGWKSGTDSDTVQNIKDNILKMEDSNVIAVDWHEVAANNFYIIPARQTREVGTYLAEMIDYLVDKRGAKINSFHLIGHSLGAHTVGYAGQFTKSGKIPRITGLDPARPLFEGISGPDGSLDPSDADFVDIIHSSAGTLGYYNPLGHADFYPNSGKASQPGCKGLYKEILEACSHGRSHQFFAESITNKQAFQAYPCNSWDNFNSGKCSNANPVSMGMYAPNTAKGVYYLKTKDSTPFTMRRKRKSV